MTTRTGLAVLPPLPEDAPWYVQHREFSHLLSAVQADAVFKSLLSLEVRPVDEAVVRAAHAPQYIDALKDPASAFYQTLDQPQSFGQELFRVREGVALQEWIEGLIRYALPDALLGAGAVCSGIQAILAGRCRNAFALVSGGGHHVERGQGRGMLNELALGAQFALDRHGLRRVAVVDYDAHFGNGVVDIFYNDPRVFKCSLHELAGDARSLVEETGSAAAPGTILNVPLPNSSGDKNYAAVIERVVIPALRRWRPELILVFTHFDAHWSDPLGCMMLSNAGFAAINAALRRCADEVCGGRILMGPGGGYHPNTGVRCTLDALRILAGLPSDPAAQDRFTSSEPDITFLIQQLSATHPLLK